MKSWKRPSTFSWTKRNHGNDQAHCLGQSEITEMTEETDWFGNSPGQSGITKMTEHTVYLGQIGFTEITEQTDWWSK